MDNSTITPTNFNTNQTNAASKSHKMGYIIAGSVAFLILIAGIVAVASMQRSNTDTAAEQKIDNVKDEDITSNVLHYKTEKDYTKGLNIYASIDNGLSLDNVKTIVQEANASDNLTFTDDFGTISIDGNEIISFELTQQENSEVFYISNLIYENEAYQESIKEINDGKYQHYTGTFTNDFDTKSEAIDDLLMRH